MSRNNLWPARIILVTAILDILITITLLPVGFVEVNPFPRLIGWPGMLMIKAAATIFVAMCLMKMKHCWIAWIPAFVNTMFVFFNVMNVAITFAMILSI